MRDLLETLEQSIPNNKWLRNWPASEHQEEQKIRGYVGGQRGRMKGGMRGGYRGGGSVGNERGFHQAQRHELEVPEDEWEVHSMDNKASLEVEDTMNPALVTFALQVEYGVEMSGTTETGCQKNELPEPSEPTLSVQETSKTPVFRCVASETEGT